MKQILQSFKTGKTTLAELPAPQVKRGAVLIQATRSLVSLGTERMLVEFGKANLIEKARQQPDKVKMVLDKMKAEGILPTLEAVFNKLEQPLPLGYCHVGKVIAVGEGVNGIQIGDRVASNGPHAEYVCVPQHLVAKVPEEVSDEEAAFTVIGSIGLQGIRLCAPTLGETIVVTGLGLIGLLTAQLLKANGCQVIGIDPDARKCEKATELGIQTIQLSPGTDPVKEVMSRTQQVGADGVIITASAKGDTIIAQAAQMCRKRGRIILVGVIGLNISRADFYEKELSFQVSCSYGPGRYDDAYEQKGIDYPLPYVRWTEKRNFEAILQAIQLGSLRVKPLITEEVALTDFERVYGDMSASQSIASLLVYPEKDTSALPVSKVEVAPKQFETSKAVIGIIGAGNFTKMTMLPALKGSGATLKYIASAGGVNGTELARKHGVNISTTDYKDILQDEELDTVLITTRHNSHARMVVEALEAEKHVFVEKPLALKADELDAVKNAYAKGKGSLMVGFNRRFSPHMQAIKNALGNKPEPMNIIATMNAGHIPPEVWVHDMEIGGGRIIGEACHYLDLTVFLTGSKISAVCMNALGKSPKENTDNASILVKFENGSQAVLNYFANGAKRYSKERIEVYYQGETFITDNFRKTEGYGVKGFKNLKTKIDKGHKAQFYQYVKSIQDNGEALIPFDQLVNVTEASFGTIQSLKEKRWVEIL